MQMARFIYISRKWEKDEVRIGKLVEYLGKHSAVQPYQLVLFPEGTNLTPSAQEKSRIYGEANNLKPLNYLLQPRTTGFTYLVQQMRERECNLIHYFNPFPACPYAIISTHICISVL